MFELLRSVNEHSYAVEVVLRRELVSSAQTLNSDAVSSDLVLLNESVLHNLSALLRKLLVELLLTLGRSITLNLHLSVLVVLHVLSNHLDASVLSLIDSSLALTEDYVRLQNILCRSNNSSSGRTSLACSELSLQVSNLLVSSGQLTSLSVVLSTQTVDLSVQTVNLSLVAELLNLEVVSTVRSTELVVNTSLQRESTVELLLAINTGETLEGISPSNSGLTQNNTRLDVNLPCLVSTQVESEVDSSLSVQTTLLGSPSAAVTTTYESDNLESTGLTLVTCEQVVHVPSGHQIKVSSVDESLATESSLTISLVSEISVNVQSQTEYGGQVLTNTKTELRSEALEETSTFSIILIRELVHVGSNTSVDTYIPVVLSFVSCNSSSLCASRHSQHSSSKH